MIDRISISQNFLEEDPQKYPYNLKNIASLCKSDLNFNSKIVFFVGENGSGKTTLIESLACFLGAKRYGGSKNFQENSSSPELEKFLLVSRFKKIGDVFFFRAETFFNLNEELQGYGTYGKSKNLLRQYTQSEKSFREFSHGQGFLKFFENRVYPNGVYLFDEPEAALSQASQVDLLYLLREFELKGCQIFICTHSPIILSYPGAQIFSFDGDEIVPIKYEDTRAFNQTKDFLENYEIHQRSISRITDS